MAYLEHQIQEFLYSKLNIYSFSIISNIIIKLINVLVAWNISRLKIQC